MTKKLESLESLFKKFDVARSLAKTSATTMKDISDEIKTALGDTTEVDTPLYVTTFKYDKDIVTEVFDEEKFEAKDPKGYAKYVAALELCAAMAKKYTKTKTAKGTRKLYVTLKNEGEE